MKGFAGIEKIKSGFAKQTTLDNALRYMSGDARWCHNYYQHYTTLERVIDKINGYWWMTRADSVNLNDRQESSKYSIKSLYSKTYQISLCHGKAESAAMWGLYAKGNPFAVRITIPADKMKLWIDSIHVDESSTEREKLAAAGLLGHKKLSGLRMVDIRDVIYAPASKDVNADKYTVDRYNTISWEGEFARKVDVSLHRASMMSCAILKDYEWRHERESRIIVGFETTKYCSKKSMKINIPREVIEDMRFTFSPWLEDRYFDMFASWIRQAYKAKGYNLDEKSVQRFKRSNLQNALNFTM